MKKWFVILVYPGSEPDNQTMKSLHAALCETGKVFDIERVEGFKLSEDEVMKAIAKEAKAVENVTEDKECPEAIALNGIAKRYGEQIAMHNILSFNSEFTKDLILAKMNGNDPALLRAAVILSSPDALGYMSFNTIEDAAFWRDALQCIRNAYKYVKDLP
jgi:hypothetical protein